MEKAMIEYAVSRRLRYDDYFVTIGGIVKFRCLDRKNKEWWFMVRNWEPFACVRCMS